MGDPRLLAMLLGGLGLGLSLAPAVMGTWRELWMTMLRRLLASVSFGIFCAIALTLTPSWFAGLYLVLLVREVGKTWRGVRLCWQLDRECRRHDWPRAWSRAA